MHDGVLRLNYRSAVDGYEDWSLILPPENGDTWVVCLHGHGSHGDQLYTRDDIRESCLPCFIEHGFGILTPNLRDNAWMGPDAVDDLKSLLDFARKEYGAKKFVFAGGSMGGTSNLIYAAIHPEDVAGVIALGAAVDLNTYYLWAIKHDNVVKEIADAIEASYGGTPNQCSEIYETHSALENSDRLKMPVYIAHGNVDSIIPVSQPQQLAEKMDGADNFIYKELPGGEHDSPLAYMQEAVEWVMSRI